MTLAELHEHALLYLRRWFKDHGEMPLTFFALDRAQSLHLLCVPKYPEKRTVYQALITAYFAHHGVSAYGFAAEVWYAVDTLDAVEQVNGKFRMAEGVVPAGDRPDRKEALGTAALDANEILYRAFAIDRPAGKPPRIGKEIFRPGPAHHERAGLMGFIVDHANLTEETKAMAGAVVADAIRRGYLPIRRIVPQMVYDRGRN